MLHLYRSKNMWLVYALLKTTLVKVSPLNIFFSLNSPHFHVNVFRNVSSVLLLLQTFQQVAINNELVAIFF